ncbi:uncharacterized protein LOC125228345 [Leguminivora glycinivorella]|uniref:uncharacterized protein LOC125228345 n=1 Tax=Leguminivora glycinivorella TaxID=1035111 RepID=UPI00200F9D67|nr:uncharacterized protein LOC125228345 [Leguminivora glycinivorella]
MTPPVGPRTMSGSHVRRSDRAVLNEQSILSEFLKLYRAFPCLWDQRHMHYANREIRDSAYEELLEKFKLYQADGTVVDVKKKIEHMRCAYRRERKKVLMSKFRGGNYKPHLWYYNLLRFLNEEEEQDEDNDQQEFKNEYEDSFQETTQIVDSDEEETKPKRSKITHNSSNNMYVEQFHNEEEYLEPEILEQDQDNIVLPQSYIINNEAEAFGRTIGFQLKELTNMQRILAEKLISDVIFQARLDKLTVDTTIASDD